MIFLLLHLLLLYESKTKWNIQQHSMQDVSAVVFSVLLLFLVLKFIRAHHHHEFL